MKIYLRTIKYLFENKKWLFILTILAMLAAILSLIGPLFYRKIVDVLLEVEDKKEAMSSLAYVLIFWASVSFLGLFIDIFRKYYTSMYVHKIHLKMWPKAIEKLLSLELKYHTDNRAGKVMKSINTGADFMWETQNTFMRQDLPNVLTIVFLLGLISYFNWKMAVIIVLLVPIFILLSVYIMAKTNKRQDKAEEKWSKASGFSLDSVSNIAVVKSFTAFKLKMSEIVKLITNAHHTQVKIEKWWTGMSTIASFLSIIATMSIFLVGTYLYSQEEISIGELVMFAGYASITIGLLENELWNFQGFMWRRSKIKEFLKVWNTVPKIEDAANAKELTDVIGRVEFQNVTFSHDNDRETIKKVSFKVAPGQTIALVGHTGSGKSTTVSLLSRFFDIDSGKILIDDHDIKEVTRESLRRNIGMVFQENILFHDTVKKNLLIGNPDASDHDIKKACHAAYTLEFINKFPKKFDTIVGERGVRLSGGERQRVAIARALIKNPPIMILDEATSALDAETEQKIQKALEKLMDDRTTFIVAHRLSTIKRADRIFVFDHGQIVEQGNYKSLMAKKGRFAKLVQAQISGYTKE